MDTLQLISLFLKRSIWPSKNRLESPFQIGLGIAAGAFGFFHNTIFITIESMAETSLVAVITFAYLRIAGFRRNLRLWQREFNNREQGDLPSLTPFS